MEKKMSEKKCVWCGEALTKLFKFKYKNKIHEAEVCCHDCLFCAYVIESAWHKIFEIPFNKFFKIIS